LPKPLPKSLPNGPAGPTAGLSREQARALALEAGFSEAGLVALPYVHEQRDAERFEEWVRAGRAGSMRYLERRGEDGRLLRARIPFPWARSVVVCLANYNSPQPRSTDPAAAGAGWIARYAWSSKLDAAQEGRPKTRRPSDYHKVLLKRMKALEMRLHEQWGEFEARAYVDTGPVVERALAAEAGLGWTGKNTCLIHPRLGSYGFLAVLITSLEARPEEASPSVPEGCGGCRRCLEACPTKALVAPYQMDAARCIAYLTIEHRGAIAPELMEGMGRQVFGCDICQDVCPWNQKAMVKLKPKGADHELNPELNSELEARPELVNPALEWLASMNETAFERHFNGSPLRRAGFLGLKRNVAIAMGNSGISRFIPLLESWETEPCTGVADEGLRVAARWALGRLRGRAV
jgi:epoxyqueuosine reductase